MKLTVLFDNNSRPESNPISEHGLSFLIEDDSRKLLFDCGSTDMFIKNTYNMDIDMSKITDVILSHGHSGRIGGLARLQALYENFRASGVKFNPKMLIAHPYVFKPEDGDMYTGDNHKLSEDELDEFFNIILTSEAKFLSKKLIYLGGIPVRFDDISKDYSPDETALAYKSEKGLIIFSGCSHCGLRNIIDYATYITGVEKIETVFGGVYLINSSDDEVNELGKYLQKKNIEHIYPCNCADDNAKTILSNYVKVEDTSAGSQYVWQ
ncbi:MBL fold metallo-hydrolase [bacterium]|nr:MBL fold metallo-hydrolase [bacterium]